MWARVLMGPQPPPVALTGAWMTYITIPNVVQLQRGHKIRSTLLVTPALGVHVRANGALCGPGNVVHVLGLHHRMEPLLQNLSASTMAVRAPRA